jgi:hypothetical protein
LLGLGVETPGLGLVFKHLADDDRTLNARVLRDLADWGLKRPEYDVDAGLDVGIVIVGKLARLSLQNASRLMSWKP